jgi:hypothetical protein
MPNAATSVGPAWHRYCQCRYATGLIFRDGPFGFWPHPQETSSGSAAGGVARRTLVPEQLFGDEPSGASPARGSVGGPATGWCHDRRFFFIFFSVIVVLLEGFLTLFTVAVFVQVVLVELAATV